MRLLGIGVVLAVFVPAFAVLFHKIGALEKELHEANKPRFQLIASSR